MYVTRLAIAAAVMILVIAALRRRLVFELQGTSLLIFGNPRIGIFVYSLIFLPGTILHELSHWIVAEILQVPTGKLSVLPSLEADGQGEEKLGYVMTGRTGIIRGFLIGFAPMFTGIAVLVVLGYLLDTLWPAAPVWQMLLVIYGLVVVSNSMIVSGADRRHWPVAAVLFILTGLVIVYAGITVPVSVMQFASRALYRIDQILGLTIGLNLAMIIGSYVLRRILERVTNKRVMRGR